MTISAQCGAIVAAVCLLSGTAGAAKGKAELKDWPDGPIRYISRKAEIEHFRSLKTDDERGLAIERFWARRDPTPDTLANEYRQLFWERVSQANAMFLDSTKPGWLTDRGKIFILYGPPSEIEEEVGLVTDASSSAGRGLIRWIYDGRPAGRLDLDPIVVVPFVPGVGGEYRVSYDPKLSSVFFDAAAIREQRDRKIERFLEIFGTPLGDSELSVMLDLGRMQEVPPQEQVLIERIEMIESFRTRPIAVAVSRFRHRDRGGTAVLLTVDLSDLEAGVQPAILARLTSREATRQSRVLGEDSFVPAEIDGARVAQGRLVLEPGTYDLTVLLADPSTARTGIHRETVSIAEPSGTMRFSDLVWAASLASLRYAALSSYDEPYHIGPFHVMPDVDGSFARGDSIRLFYEIYGGEPPYRVSYQLEGQDTDGSWVSLGEPSRGEQDGDAQAWELPTTEDWPLGAYRLRVDVDDAAGRLISTQAPFTLHAADR